MTEDSKITKQQIQEKISQAIKNSGKSQSQIAKELGVSQQTISRYVTGEHFPSLNILANLCKMLNLNANEIFCIN